MGRALLGMKDERRRRRDEVYGLAFFIKANQFMLAGCRGRVPTLRAPPESQQVEGAKFGSQAADLALVHAPNCFVQPDKTS